MMSMKKHIISLIVLFLTNFAFSQSDSTKIYFDKANELYKNQDYQNAIVFYHKILNTNNHSAELYYNLGNSYLKNNQIPQSILYYEKALKLKPNNEDIKSNLDYANLFINNEIQHSSQFIIDRIILTITNSMSSNTWAILSIIFLVLTLAQIAIFLFAKSHRTRKLSFFSSMFTFVLVLFLLLMSYQNMQNIIDPKQAIIMQTTSLKSSPSEKGTDLYIINPGIKVQINNFSDQWYEVRLPNGTKGWILNQKIEKI